MNVKELIDLLAAYPPGFRVVVQGYEDGYDDLARSQIVKRKITLNTGRNSWQGLHGDPSWATDQENQDAEKVDAVVLHRNSC